MHIHAARILVAVCLMFSSFSLSAQSLELSEVNPWVLEHTDGGAEAEFLVLLKAQADLSPADSLDTREEKGAFVVDALRVTSKRTQMRILKWLKGQGVPHRSYYSVNLIWVKAGRAVVEALRGFPEVRIIEGNPVTRGLTERGGTQKQVDSTLPWSVEPGILYTKADQVWALGFTGQGVVIGNQDTGIDWTHPAIQQQYRGWSSATTDHNYNWHDAIHSGGGGCGSNSSVPCDDNGHGTHTMGTAVGDDGGSNQIGMAPGSQWIGARNMDQGNGTPATYIECFEFFLAPYPIGGVPAMGNPALAPDVTSNSWGCPPSEGCTALSLHLAVQAQRAAGIITVVSAGNSGSSCSSVDNPPAIYDEVYSVGAHRHSNGNLAGFSSRGPVTVDMSNRMKPDICAPGVSVSSAANGGGYTGGWSGTSMAGPHVAGAVALLISAHPALRGQVAVVEQVLNDSADHVSSTTCSSSGWPNNKWGYGRLDVLKAVESVRGVAATVSASTVSAQPGATALQFLTVTNTGYLTDSFALSSLSSGLITSFSPAVTAPIPAGGSATVAVSVLVSSWIAPGANVPVTVVATSQGFSTETSTDTFTVSVSPAAQTLLFSQSGGPGSPLTISNQNMVVGHEYINLFTIEPCSSGLGTGPYLGLCTTDLPGLMNQLTQPLGTLPFHYTATSSTANFGPYPLISGLVIDGVCLDFTGGILGAVSPVARIVLQ